MLPDHHGNDSPAGVRKQSTSYRLEGARFGALAKTLSDPGATVLGSQDVRRQIGHAK
jgi:hypothetical protein